MFALSSQVNGGLSLSGTAERRRDFRTPTPFGARIQTDDEQLKLAGGYDHHWVLDKPTPNAFVLAASAWEPTSGRFMEVFTTEPGLQVPSASSLRARADPSESSPYRPGEIGWHSEKSRG